MEQTDAISMALLDCVLRQAGKEAGKPDEPGKTTPEKAGHSVDALLSELASRHAQHLIDRRSAGKRKGPRRRAA